VTSQTELARPAQFSDIVIRTVNGFPGAHARCGARGRRRRQRPQPRAPQWPRCHLDGRDPPGHGQPAGAVCRCARDAAHPEGRLAADITIDIANDNSVFIDRSVKSVYQTIAEAVVLVALVIFVFLRTLRASIIPIITIPVSLVGSFALMALAGFSINTLTLLALVLAIGLVVDDAIVMLENIYRHIEEGLDPFSAAIKGAREIGFAIVAMTLTLVAVYAPLAFTPGRTGRLFVEFALALAGAVVVSGFVALTLSPMMCSLLLKHNPKPNWFDRSMERWLTAMSDAYGRLLRWVVTARWGGGGGLRGALFQGRWLVVGVMLASAVGLALVYPKMKQELSPLEDRGTILVNVTAPDGATLDYTNRYALELEKIGRDYPEFDRIFANIGNPTVAQGSVIYRTVDWEQRERSTLDMARELQPKVGALPGVNAFLITPPSLGQGFRSRPLTYVIQTSDSYENLNAVTRQMLAEMAKNPGIIARCRPAPEQARAAHQREPRARSRPGRGRGRGGAGD
jgi:multidrug efflux pump